MSATKTVGVLGGMGPEATVDFMAKVIELTPADKDQDHIRMIVDHNPTVPNRQAAILGVGEDPGPVLADMARRLESAGADFLVIPCNTAYGFRDSVENAVDIPLVSIIDVTIDAVGELAPGARSVGLLATDGCLQASVYQNAMKANDLVPVLLDDVEMEKFMTLVNGIKAGYKGEVVANSMHQLANALIDRGAEVIIAGCTEVPLVLQNSKLGVPLASSTDVLAQKTVQLAKPE